MWRSRRTNWPKAAVAVAIALFSFGQANAAPAIPRAPAGALDVQTTDQSLTLVHGRHCGRAYSHRWGWHRHPRACRRFNRRRYDRRYRNRNRHLRSYSREYRRDYRRGRVRPGVPHHRKALSQAYRKRGREGH